MFGVPEGGSWRRADVGPSRIPSTARFQGRPAVAGAAAVAPTATAVATAEYTFGIVHGSVRQFGNERVQFVLGVGPRPRPPALSTSSFRFFESCDGGREDNAPIIGRRDHLSNRLTASVCVDWSLPLQKRENCGENRKKQQKWKKNGPDPLRRSARLCVFVCLGKGWGPEQSGSSKKYFFFFHFFSLSSVYMCAWVYECLLWRVFQRRKAKKGAGRVRKIFARPEC